MEGRFGKVGAQQEKWWRSKNEILPLLIWSKRPMLRFI